jgi:hypothetical protein
MSQKKEPKTTERVIFAGVAVILIPITLITGWLANRSFDEEILFKNTPDFVQDTESRRNGTFGKVTGPLEAELLNPKDWPEITQALEYAVYKENKGTSHWEKDKEFKKIHAQVSDIKVGSMPVHLSRGSQYFLKMNEIKKPIRPGERYVLRWVSPNDQVISAFGVYQHGTLKEGNYERMILMPAQEEDRWIKELAKGGMLKGYILGGVAFFMVCFIAGALRMALRKWPQNQLVTS